METQNKQPPLPIDEVRRRLAARREKCDDNCPGWIVSQSSSYGLQVERCDECVSYAAADRTRPQDAAVWDDDDVAQLPEALAELAREQKRMDADMDSEEAGVPPRVAASFRVSVDFGMTNPQYTNEPYDRSEALAWHGTDLLEARKVYDRWRCTEGVVDVSLDEWHPELGEKGEWSELFSNHARDKDDGWIDLDLRELDANQRGSLVTALTEGWQGAALRMLVSAAIPHVHVRGHLRMSMFVDHGLGDEHSPIRSLRVQFTSAAQVKP